LANATFCAFPPESSPGVVSMPAATKRRPHDADRTDQTVQPNQPIGRRGRQLGGEPCVGQVAGEQRRLGAGGHRSSQCSGGEIQTVGADVG
jgi:hypothetical protein